METPETNTRPVSNGFLNLDKPPGMTSMDVVRRVKRITGQSARGGKVGHGGTMDPLARGVLPICFGQATRLMDYVVEGTKRYLVEVKLGLATTTYDAEGQITQTRDVSGLTREQVEATLPFFIGVIQQTPPMYSAIKVEGQRLYKLARAGVEVERKARTVEVYNIRLLDFSPPTLKLDVESGRGAYMRSLAHDLGQALGCGGYVSDLVRLQCGEFRVEEAIKLEQLEQASAASPNGWQQFLHPIDWVLRGMKSISVGRQAEKFLLNGQPVNLGRPVGEVGYMERFRAYTTDGRFLAVLRFDRGTNSWRPAKVFHIASPSPYTPVSQAVVGAIFAGEAPLRQENSDAVEG